MTMGIPKSARNMNSLPVSNPIPLVPLEHEIQVIPPQPVVKLSNYTTQASNDSMLENSTFIW